MIVEVQEAERQWASVTARIFSQQTFCQFVVGFEQMAGEGQDSHATKDAVTNVFAKANVPAGM